MIDRAIQWIQRNSLSGQGIIVHSRQRICYPEVTGYFIPTLLATGFRDLAQQYARWLVSVQKADGSFGLDGNAGSFAFDTGQVIRGWVELVSHLPELEQPLRRACEWLIKTANERTGRLLTPRSGGAWSLGRHGEVSEAIHLYVLRPLERAGEALAETRYGAFARKSLSYYLKEVPLTDFTAPGALTHFYAYVQEALVELGCEDVARRGMDGVARFQRENGAVPGYCSVPWVCSTGLAQLAQVWYRLGQPDRADRAMQFLSLLQNPSGGFFGGYGPGADYFPSAEISWAAKYAIEAAQQQIAAHFDTTVSQYRPDLAESDGRAQAVLRSLGDLNGRRVLDAGCGKGRYAALLRRKFPHAKITALDISPEMLAHVPAGIQRVRSGMLNLPFEKGAFDAVLCVEALEHAVNIDGAVRELGRVLAPGGQLVIIDKNADKLGALQMPHWEKWFKAEELLTLIRNEGFEAQVESIGYDQVVKPDGLFLCWTARKPGLNRPANEPANGALHGCGLVAPGADSPGGAESRIERRSPEPARDPVADEERAQCLRMFDPRSLLGDRLGLTLYCLYAEALLRGRISGIRPLYQKFLAAFNEQEHSPDSFDRLIYAMKTRGFDFAFPVYGNLKEFALVNGAHRCATAIALGLTQIPYCLRFADNRTPDEAFARVFTTDELAMLRSEQDRFIAQCEPGLSLRCKVRKLIRAHPRSFSAPFSSKNTMQAIRPYQGMEKLGILGKRPVEKRAEVYGMARFIKGHMRVLEIGCNSGFLALETASYAAHVTAFDADPVYIQLGNLVKEHLQIHNCSLLASPVERFQTQDTYDAVISCAVHGWIKLSFEEFVRRILAWLKPGGLFIFETHEIDCHPEVPQQREYLLQFFELLRRGYIDDVDESLYQSEMREYLVLKKKQ